MKLRNFYTVVALICCVMVRQTNLLYSHGLHRNSIVLYKNGAYITSLATIIDRVKKNKSVYVSSYDTKRKNFVEKRVRAAGFSSVPCYCVMHVNHECLPIICSPTQQFYRLTDQQWVSVEALTVGDTLLAHKNGSVTITRLEFVPKQLAVFTIHVKDTYTFLVSNYGVVTHNVILPVAATFGATIPFSTGCGSSIGAIFGPPGFICGIALGIGFGFLVNTWFKDRYVEYGVTLKANNDISYLFKNENVVKKNEDSKIEKLPKEGNFPFIPPKSKDGKIPKNKNGAYVDKKGNEWKWDSKKEEWDVSNKNGHWNINTEGDQTHKGSHPTAQSHTSKSYKRGS